MKTKIPIHIIIVFLLIVTLNSCFNSIKVPELSSQQPFILESQLNKNNLQIADPFEYTVNLYKLNSSDVNLKKIEKDQFKNLNLLDFKEEIIDVKPKNTKVIKQTYKLQSKNLDEAIIPSIEAVSSSGNKKLDQIKLKAVSTMKPNSQMNDVHDIKEIEKFFIFSHWYITIPIITIITLVLIILIIYFILKKIKKKTSPEIIRLPHEIAYEELAKLKTMKVESYEELKLFFTLLSEILRNYISARFGILAIERTSEEILQDLNNIEINLKTKNLAKLVLRESDLVKFAKYKPDKDSTTTSLDLTYQFISATKTYYPTSETKEKAINV